VAERKYHKTLRKSFTLSSVQFRLPSSKSERKAAETHKHLATVRKETFLLSLSLRNALPVFTLSISLPFPLQQVHFLYSTIFVVYA
jgi:hypothetical protein